MNTQALYDRAPYPVQALLFNAYALKLHVERYGNSFRQLASQFERTQWFDANEMREYQEGRLRDAVQHAYDNTAFYRARFDAAGIAPRDIQTLADLSRLPILEKDDVRANYAAMRARSVAEDQVGKGSTSGTTGSPLTVAWDRTTQIVNNVVDWRQKAWAGIVLGDRIAQILGRTIVDIRRERPPFWQYDLWHRQLWMSAFHMRDDCLAHYAKKLVDFAPAALEGYPSTMIELARYIQNSGARRPRVRAVFTSSEPLLAEHRETIESVFQAPVFDFYGTAERVLFATQCDRHDGQHVNMEFGILEVLDASGKPCAPGEEGQIVATSLWNRAMPMLRYRLGDRTTLITEPCACGRQSVRMTCVQTKFEDTVIRPDGTRISPSILTHPFKPIATIEKSQVVQTHADRIELRIVRRSNYGDDDEARLLSAFRARVGPSMTVSIRYVDDIPRTRAGKYRWVINEARANTVVSNASGIG